MKRRDRLATLRQLAEHAETEQKRRLAERLRALDSDEKRLRQIHGYLQEYERVTGNPGRSTTVGALRSGRGFVDRLRTAVGEQQGLVENQRRQLDQQTIQWRAARAKSLALEKLAEKRARAEVEERDSREQRRLDEMAVSRRGR